MSKGNGSGYLSRDAILGIDDHSYRDVDVPEWGGTLRIRTLSGEEHEQFVQDLGLLDEGKASGAAILGRQARARLIYLAAVDAQGHRLFSHEDDIARLQGKNTDVLMRVCQAIMDLNGMGAEAAEALQGESEADRSGDSSSVSA